MDLGMLQSLGGGRIVKKIFSKFLKNIKLEADELQSSLILYEDHGDLMLVVVTLRLNENNNLEVARTIEVLDMDKLNDE
jgi:hypothetical protein